MILLGIKPRQTLATCPDMRHESYPRTAGKTDGRAHALTSQQHTRKLSHTETHTMTDLIVSNNEGTRRKIVCRELAVERLLRRCSAALRSAYAGTTHNSRQTLCARASSRACVCVCVCVAYLLETNH
jgi:hypothetical protein